MFLNILIILSSTYIAYSFEECKTQGPCRCVFPNNEAIDVSSVGGRDFPRFYQVAFPPKSENNETQCELELFTYNPCFSFDSTDKHVNVTGDKKRCLGAAACIRTPGTPDGGLPEEYMIASQSTATFQTDSSKAVSIKYTVPGSDRVLVVNLNCSKNQDLHELKLDNYSTTYIGLTLFSKCACPNVCSSTLPVPSSSSGLSVGSKLLIVFFSILLAYILVGVIWNYCNGSQGIELIPNVEFWNGLPTLIMEGVSFTCSCCGRQSSYGEV